MNGRQALLKLTADLRQMDQIVFRMSQCENWPVMRPIFQELLALTNSRIREESNRIRALLIPVIVETYVNAETTKQIEAPRPAPQLEGPKHASAPRLQDGKRKRKARNRPRLRTALPRNANAKQ